MSGIIDIYDSVDHAR